VQCNGTDVRRNARTKKGMNKSYACIEDRTNVKAECIDFTSVVTNE
jgi:hypothetical protein